MDIVDWVKKQTGKIADNVKDYKFYVKHSPDYIDSSTTLTLTAFNNRDQTSTVPCIYRWSRIKNGLVSEVPEFKGNCFICEPSDVGSIIQAEITSTDPTHPGTAILKYGPVKFDIKIKRQIEHGLSSGGSVFNVNLLQNNRQKECQIKINEDNIKINHCNSSVHYIFEYNLSEPRIEASLRAPNKANIYFTERHESQVKNFVQALFGEVSLSESAKSSNQQKLQLKFEDRSLRDNFLFILKSFNTKKALKNSAIVKKIENIDLNKNDNINYLLEIDSLREDLFKLGNINDKYLRDKKMYFEEARRYEKEIEQIIRTYTKIAENKCRNINQLDQSVLELRQKKDEVMDRKIHGLMNQNSMLKQKLESMNQELTHRGLSHLAQSSIGKVMYEEERIPTKTGFGKKKHYEEVSATGNQFNTILEKLNESEVKDSSNESEQVKMLNEQKNFLVKKLNDSVIKVAKLEEKIKKMKLNYSAIELNNQSSMSMQANQRGNITQYELGEEKNSRISQTNSMKYEKSNNPNVGSDTQRYLINTIEVEKVQGCIKSQQNLNPQESNEIHRKFSQLKKQNENLIAENERLKDELQMKNIEIQVITKQKVNMEAKYKKKLHELLNDNSMYRKNQDALNRSQNISIEMDMLNGEEIQFLKQQNQFLAKENERHEKSLKKYMAQLKEIPKLREQILDLKTKLCIYEKKNTGLSISKSSDSILLNN